jgi:hypothetical protein
MSNFFGLDSGSDSDNENFDNVQAVEDEPRDVLQSDEPNSYWFEFSDDEALEQVRGRLMSKEQRSATQIENVIQECDYVINFSSEKPQQRWQNGMRKIEKMAALVRDHKTRYTSAPASFLEFLGDSLEWASSKASDETKTDCVPVAVESQAGEHEAVASKRRQLNGILAVLNRAMNSGVDEGADDDKDLREAIAGWKQQQKFLQLIDELITEFARDLARGPVDAETLHDEEAAQEQQTEKGLDEAAMTKILNSILDGSSDGSRKQLSEIVKESASQRLVYLQVTATSLLVKALTQADTRLATWSEALDNAKTAFRLANSDTHPVAVAITGTVAPGRAVIMDGFSSLVSILRESLLWICQLQVPENRGFHGDGVPVNFLEITSDAVFQENLLLRFADQVYAHYNKKTKNSFAKDVRRKASKSLLNIMLDIVGLRNDAAHANMMKQFSRSSVPWCVVKPTALATVEAIRSIVYTLPTDELRDRPDETRDRATLYYANQLSLSGDFMSAQDLLVMSQLRDRIVKLTFKTAILYNRACAQIGLSAFESGNYSAANQTLTPLFDHKVPERFALYMLGQTPADPDDRRKPGESVESMTAREVARRSVCLAPHLHLPFHKVEFAAYCSTLLDECVPEARRPFDRPRSSEHFHRVISKIPQAWGLEQAINTAYKALKKGDAKEAIRAVFMLSTAGEFSGDVQLRLKNQIKDAALRVFFYVNLSKYLSFSLAKLSETFELDPTTVRNILNQLILQRDSNVVAFWNTDETHIRVDRGNPSTLEHLMECTAEKVVSFSALANGAQAASGKGARRGRFWAPRQQ